MRVISVNVGMPGEIRINDQPVLTGIFKTPVAGLVRLTTLNLDGDQQADLTVHGGPDKAVYIYPSEHYSSWKKTLGQNLDWGAFGENISAAGLAEDTTNVGDQFSIGTAVLEVTQPRLPCFKLAAKFQRDDIIKRFLASRKTGFYTRVLQEGVFQAGDSISVSKLDPHGVSIRDLIDLYLMKRPRRSHLDRALAVEALSASWREHFDRILSRML